ncbi:amino acid ABC transporter permease [Caldisericum exile]|uniref:Amino acid ABC transporter permease protein n=1 Tax=Caldisericum exile (strain DSM 21853 / NBRC 104410 / AZM16c01) TaxID=511051 RepID=A0A7U6GFJ6_CALEA|nr:amino acid ABC transporter permease [Caldisericum exile]BAL81473.1 amino acid ABC transporter permease protein [Caldisericum exile AZM16c01]
MNSLEAVLTRYKDFWIVGLKYTMWITVASILIGIVLGLLFAIMRIYGNRFFKAIAVAYIDLIRGTPMIVQLFILYYGLGSTGIVKFTPLQAAIIGMGLNSGAYQAEYFRTAFLAIPTGQTEAALSLGMTRVQLIFNILLPQVIRIVLPSWTNELIALTQYSSLAMVLTVMELTAVSKYVGSKTFLYIQAFSVAGVIYLFVSVVLTRLMVYFENRLSIPGVSAQKLRI